MRRIVSVLGLGAVGCVASGCAGLDGVAHKELDFAIENPGDSEARRPGEAMPTGGDGARRREPAPVAKPAVALRRPRPDGPNLDVYKSGACAATLRSVSADAAVSPSARALASEVLKCDGPGEDYDVRHAPCPLFAQADDDRQVDLAIQELRAVAPACGAPSG